MVAAFWRSLAIVRASFPLSATLWAWIRSASRRVYQRSMARFSAISIIPSRYARTLVRTIARRVAASKPRSRPAASKLAARRLTSHSHGPGSVSSKSLISKTSFRSGDWYRPKFIRWASPHSCAVSPESGVPARSDAMSSAPPR